jgi:hypothetical protein
LKFRLPGHCPTAPQLYYYDSPINNNSYVLDTHSKTFNEAEGFCAGTFGGHLVAYHNLEEQAEVRGTLAVA